MEMLDITMTAALRPRIVERTLQSLSKDVIWQGTKRLIIDIAQVGDVNASQADIKEIALKYFPNAIIRALKINSLQAEAQKWVWQSSESDFILQWEDDWVARWRIDLMPVIKFMEQKEDIGMVYLDRYEKSVLNYEGYKDKFQYLHSGFWERTKEKSLGGPPAILRKEYAQEVTDMMQDNVCLDVLSGTKEAQELLKRWGIYVYAEHIGNLVEDTGKQWKKENNIQMSKRSDVGVQWIRL